MNIWRHLLLLALAFQTSGFTLAADPSPSTIFGIRFTEKLAIANCPYGGGSTLKSGPCVSHERIGSKRDVKLEEVWINYPFGELPSWISGSRFKAFLVNGNVERIWIITTGISGQSAALSSLTAKYGKHVGLSSRPMQNGFGARFESFEAVWQVGDTGVVFNSVVEGTENGTVTIGTARGNQRYQEWTAAQNKTRRL